MDLHGKNREYCLEKVPFGNGGEADIYGIVGDPRLAAKIYHDSLLTDDYLFLKVTAQMNYEFDSRTRRCLAWPEDILRDGQGRFRGYVMKRFRNYFPVSYINLAGNNALTPEKKRSISENLCSLVSSLHGKGIIAGDMNGDNILADPVTGEVVLVDTDSFHLEGFPCRAYTSEYTAPELLKKLRSADLNHLKTTFTRETDCFAMAIHIFSVWMEDYHPYDCRPLDQSGQAPEKPDACENILRGFTPFFMKDRHLACPVFAPGISEIDKGLAKLLKKSFTARRPAARPGPEEYLKCLGKMEREERKAGKKSRVPAAFLLTACICCLIILPVYAGQEKLPAFMEKFGPVIGEWKVAAEGFVDTARENLSVFFEEESAGVLKEGFVFPDSDRRLLEGEDILRLEGKCEESGEDFQNMLRRSINEIYARRGGIFGDAFWKEIFEGCDWYQGTCSLEEARALMTDVEKDNTDFLAEEERLRGYR